MTICNAEKPIRIVVKKLLILFVLIEYVSNNNFSDVNSMFYEIRHAGIAVELLLAYF